MNLDGTAADQLDRVVELVQGQIGTDLLGVALYGSAVGAGLGPTSDLDLFVVISRPTTAAQRARLVRQLMPISGSRATAGPARSIELTMVVQSAVRPWRYPPAMDFQYGDWLRVEFERGDPAPWDSPNPDLAVLMTEVRDRSVTLHGAAMLDLLDPVPRDDLFQAMLDEVPGLLADAEGDTRNVVLTLARMWTTLATGEIRSKDAAVDWVMERVPAAERPVLERARAQYLSGAEEHWDDLTADVGRHTAAMEVRIRKSAGDGP
jgi:predicted nucleotidyltransferase